MPCAIQIAVWDRTIKNSLKNGNVEIVTDSSVGLKF